MKNAGALATRLTVTVGLLAVLVLVVADPREIVARIAHMRLAPMVAAVVLSAVDRVVMAYKWWLLLRAQKLAVRLWTAVRTYFAPSSTRTPCRSRRRIDSSGAGARRTTGDRTSGRLPFSKRA